MHCCAILTRTNNSHNKTTYRFSFPFLRVDGHIEPRCFAVDEALRHPYLAPLHDINEEPVCPRLFSFDFEQPSFTEENIKELVWRESVKFNPDPA